MYVVVVVVEFCSVWDEREIIANESIVTNDEINSIRFDYSSIMLFFSLTTSRSATVFKNTGLSGDRTNEGQTRLILFTSERDNFFK